MSARSDSRQSSWSVREQTELNCLSHGAKSGGRRMQMISAVEDGEEMIMRLRITDDRVKVGIAASH